MNTSIDESSKFPMSSSSSTTITIFFLKGYFFQLNRDVFENKTVKTRQVNICKRILFDFFFIHISFISSAEKIVTKPNQIK